MTKSNLERREFIYFQVTVHHVEVKAVQVKQFIAGTVEDLLAGLSSALFMLMLS